MKNKSEKRWLIPLLPIFLISLYNRWIFWKANKKKREETTSTKKYHWKWGKINYAVEGTGKPLLLIHGIGAGNSSFEWNKNICELKKDYRVYAIDLLGFGVSDKPKITYTAFLYIQLIRDFIQEIIQEPTHVMASSLSCSFTIMACQQYPHLFQKLILICPTGIKELSQYPTKKKQFLKKVIECPLLGTSLYNCISSQYYCKYFLQNQVYYYPKNVTRKILQTYYRCAHVGGPSARYAIASFLGDFMNVDVSSAISTLSHPILIFWGREAKLLPVKTLQSFKNLNSNIQSIIVPNTRLLPHGEASHIVNKHCHSFLK